MGHATPMTELAIIPGLQFCSLRVINLSRIFALHGMKKQYTIASDEDIERYIEESLSHEEIHSVLRRMHEWDADEALNNVNRVNIDTGEAIWEGVDS